MKGEYPCDIDNICPYDAKYASDCEKQCGLGVVETQEKLREYIRKLKDIEGVIIVADDL